MIANLIYFIYIPVHLKKTIINYILRWSWRCFLLEKTILKNFLFRKAQIQSFKIVSFFHNIIIEINFSVSFHFFFLYLLLFQPFLYILNSTVRLFFIKLFSQLKYHANSQRLYLFWSVGRYFFVVCIYIFR